MEVPLEGGPFIGSRVDDDGRVDQPPMPHSPIADAIKSSPEIFETASIVHDESRIVNNIITS